jgi:hypothetical protein
VTDVNLVLAKLAALNEQVARMERRRASDLEAWTLTRQQA